MSIFEAKCSLNWAICSKTKKIKHAQGQAKRLMQADKPPDITFPQSYYKNHKGFLPIIKKST